MAGVYIHIPFCAKKCAYCNFYSACTEKSVVDKYMQALYREVKKWGGSLGRPVETLYIGGGTPSVLKGELLTLLELCKNRLCLTEDAEITVEMNPTDGCEEFLRYAAAGGVNRLSIGAQSANDRELKLLGRNHTAKSVFDCVNKARRLGFENISLDLMLGLPDSSIKKLESSLDFITELEPQHISAYILKIEEKTALSFNKSLHFADDGEQAEQYLFVCDYLRRKGYKHYEISNFSKQGFESRHNIKYWKCEEYLGIGASAHSFLNGKRFYYPPDIRAFCQNPVTVPNGNGGDYEEYFMLRLRLDEGINLKEFSKEFGISLNEEFYSFAQLLNAQGLIGLKGDSLWLTDRGMLLSNAIIIELLERMV